MKSEARTGALERAAWLLVCIFVFSIPWEKSVPAPGAATLSHLFGILAFVAGTAAAARRRSVRPPNLALVWASLMVAWFALTWFWSVDPQASVARALTFAELLAMLWLLWDQCRDSARQRRLMQAYILGAMAASASAFVRYSQNLQTYYQRYAAPGFDPNDFGLILTLSIPLALYLALRSPGRARWLYYAAVLVAISAIFLTASRTALIATFVAFAFVFLTWRQADRQQRAAGALLLLALAAGLFLGTPAASRERLSTIATEITSGTLHDRTTIWKAGAKVFKRHPVLGIGTGAYPEAVRPWIGTPGVPGHQYVAHNSFLSVLVESGLIGFALYALALGTLLVFVWTMPSAERALWFVMLAAWAVGVSTLTWEHYKPSWLIMALVMTEWARPHGFTGGRE